MKKYFLRFWKKMLSVKHVGIQSEVSGRDVAGPSTRRQTNACLLCGSSILNRRSDKILRENPNEMQQSIIDLITSKLAPREISSLDRICHTCWVRSQREIIRGNLHNENRPLADITNIENQPSNQYENQYIAHIQ
ncbi:hypothetical protein ACJJTC_017449 [Scirpophaga incertulas]